MVREGGTLINNVAYRVLYQFRVLKPGSHPSMRLSVCSGDGETFINIGRMKWSSRKGVLLVIGIQLQLWFSLQ